MRPERFDPQYLVELATEQIPEENWLPDALSRCTKGWRESRAYIYFVNPEQPPEKLQSHECILLQHPKKGKIVVDIGEPPRLYRRLI